MTRAATATPPQFKRGDHLRVRRGYYWHHGIYVGDDRVVQFGGGIFDKPRARIDEVALSDFQRRGPIELVPKQQKWLGLWELPPALPPDEIVARANWLADRGFEGTYNLIGRNCEAVALWCVCNMGESLQRQRFQAVNASVAAVVSLAFPYFRGRGQVSAWATRLMLAYTAVRGLLLFSYYRHNARFYRDVRAYYADRAAGRT